MNPYRIIPFEEYYLDEISEMMDRIQDEFGVPFRNPDGRTIADVVGPDNLFWLALGENKVVGTIGLSRMDEHSAFLRHLFVSKEHRGKSGVSGLLLNTALEEARKRGYEYLYLGTMEQFKAAQKFYSRNGFMLIARETLPDNMPVSPMDTLFYARFLPIRIK